MQDKNRECLVGLNEKLSTNEITGNSSVETNNKIIQRNNNNNKENIEANNKKN